MSPVAELVRTPEITGDSVSPLAGLAVATSVEVGTRLGVDPSVTAAAAAELESAFRDGATVGDVVAHDCLMIDDGSPTPMHVYR